MRFGLTLFCPLLALVTMSGQSDLAPAHKKEQVTLVILGTAQDAGSPHIGCNKTCCRDLFCQPELHRKVVAMGVVDHGAGKSFLFEATPDLPAQVHTLQELLATDNPRLPDGVFLTHAHIGHYTGLMFFGREGMNATALPVYAMPRMKAFLTENGPWSQLVRLKNITINTLSADNEIILTESVRVSPFLVPHRDEFSETVGYLISGPRKTAVFIPDIDKWEKWDRSIDELIGNLDYAFLDGTFFDGDELPDRDISEVPHPLIIESMERFDHLSSEAKDKIWFIHLNHTNPALNPDSPQSQEIRARGYHIAREGDSFGL